MAAAAAAFFAQNTSIRKMEKALDSFVDGFEEVADAITALINEFIDPTTTNGIMAASVPPLAFLSLLATRLGTAWPIESVVALGHRLLSKRSGKAAIVFLLMTLDGDCLSAELVVAVRPMFEGNGRFYTIKPYLARHLPDYVHRSFHFPETVLYRMSRARLADIGTITGAISLSYSCWSSILPMLPEDVVARELNRIAESDSEFIYRLPARMHGKIDAPAIIQALRWSIIMRRGVAVDRMTIQKLRDFTSPDARGKVYTYLLEEQGIFKEKLAPMLEEWARKYPGQTVENHACPEPEPGHVCMFGLEGPGTCQDCCVNCRHIDNCSRGRIEKVQWQLSIIEQTLLPCFCAPVTAKGALTE